MARVRFLDQVPVGFYDTNNGGGTGAGFPYSGSAVITGSLLISGSGLTVTGSINADNITGSLFGTASWARNALTASYASNGGVTQLLAGPNITLSPTNGLGQVTITSNGGGGSNFNTATGSYGSFYDTTTQTTPVANIPRSMSFNTTSITNGVLISGSTSPFNTYIKVIDAGVYNIQFSAQVDKTNGGSDDVVIWLRKNGIDLTDTATTLTLPTNNSKVVAAWNWFVTAASNDYYQIIWRSSTTALRLLAEPISGTHPGIPSVILTVNRVDQFLSNTGSFSGSFTGNLLGTASYALSAKPAGSNTEIQFNSASVFSSSPSFTYNSSTDSLQQGDGVIASGFNSHAEGRNTQASGSYSHAEGEGTQAIGEFSHAEGTGTQASGLYSHAEGAETQAIGDGSHAEGEGTQAIAYSSHAEGFTTIASGSYSHAEGFGTQAIGPISHAEGANNQAIGESSHAEGQNTQASGFYSHAEGGGTQASGSYSHAEGFGTIAIGDGSHAEGQNTQASGFYSHAEGAGTYAIGPYSHAEGASAFARGDSSHAEGFNTIASGSYSHAEGFGTQAIGFASHAEGFNTIASGSYQHVQGQFNISSSAQSAFIVGNGTSDNNRSNLIFASGSQVQITGSLRVSGSITGSLFGTASNAITAQTASFISTSSTNAFVQGGNSFGLATSMLGNNDNTNLALETNGSTRIFIDKGGNIGIGSGNTTPTQTLYIQGSSAESGNVFAVANSIPTTLFTIQNAGNVGIGTATPATTLQIAGTTTTQNILVQTGATYDIGVNATRFRDAWFSRNVICGTIWANNVGFGSTNLPIYNASSAIVGTFFGTGNLLLSTGTQTDAGYKLAINSSGSLSGSLYITGSSNQTLLRIDSPASSSILFVSGSGNVGIGTASPASSLHISGSASQPLLIASSSAGTALFVSGSGNVGINTTSPARRLHVDASGSAVASSPLALTTVDVNNRVGILFGSSSLSSGRQHYLYHRNNIANVEWILDSGGAGNAQWQFQPRDDTSYGFSILTPYNKGTVILTTGINQSGIEIRPGTTSNVLFLQSGSGNVGIGTSTPSASLHISGGNMILEGSMSFSDPAKTISGLVGSTFTIKSTNNSIDIQAGSSNTIRVNSLAGRLLLIPTTYGSFPTDNTYRTQIYSNTPDTGALYISSSNVAINVDTPGNTNLLYISGSQVAIGSTTQTGARFYVNGNTLTNGNVVINGASATSGNAFSLSNLTPTSLFTIQNNGQFIIGSPTMSIAASQSAFSINHQISASNVVGGQYYGINYTPTFWQTTASQTETAFRIAATFTQSSAAATSGSNIIADFGAVNVGSQLTVTDVTSGSIYMVNDVSGLPIIEATSDWSVNMYNYPNIVFRKTGSSILITGSLNVTGSLNMSPTSSFVLPLTSSASPQTGSAFWSGSFLYVYDGTRYRSSSFA